MTRHITLDKSNPSLWIATFLNPPINLINLDTIDELQALAADLESDPEVKVIVFRSADPDFFLAHWDISSDAATVVNLPNGPTGMHPWLDVLVRISRAPVVSIAEIRGRARGAGSEFALACDMRFASLERAVLGQPEVGTGLVPGGNPMARLAGLMGRARALEAIVSSRDFSGALAERYGYVNRALPDAELSEFVDALANRIASFEKYAIAGTKAFLDEASLPANAVFPPALAAFFSTASQPNTQQRLGRLLELGLQSRSDVERNLGQALAPS
jgi:enoyl-CoA hydratase/carnithine racemase